MKVACLFMNCNLTKTIIRIKNCAASLLQQLLTYGHFRIIYSRLHNQSYEGKWPLGCLKAILLRLEKDILLVIILSSHVQLKKIYVSILILSCYIFTSSQTLFFGPFLKDFFLVSEIKILKRYFDPESNQCLQLCVSERIHSL